MHGTCLRIRYDPQQVACHSKHRSGKTGIPLGLHLDLVFSSNRRMMASLKLRLPLSTNFGYAQFLDMETPPHAQRRAFSSRAGVS
jgi:hypothetical protein